MMIIIMIIIPRSALGGTVVSLLASDNFRAGTRQSFFWTREPNSYLCFLPIVVQLVLLLMLLVLFIIIFPLIMLLLTLLI